MSTLNLLSPTLKLCFLSVFLCIGEAALIGCDSPPPGRSSGRVDPAYTTRSERQSPKVLPAALMEFSDQVPQELIQDLVDIPVIRDSPDRITVVMGDINNKTQIVSSEEFELVQSRIRNNLLQSQYAREKIRFVQHSERVAYWRDVEPQLPEVERRQLDADTTFILNGDFYRINRGSTNQYYMEFQLVHYATTEIVFSQRYDVKQDQP